MCKRLLVGGAIVIVVAIIFWSRIVGIPYWLEGLGVLTWVRRLDPLDKWLPAFLSMLIALYAIFHETLWRYSRRPRLRVKPVPSSIAIPVYVSTGGSWRTVRSFQVRLVVRNAGTERAESVEVYAAALWQESSGNLEPCEWFLPMNLTWANGDATYTGISADVERVCNVLAIWEPSARDRPLDRLPQAPDGFDYESRAFVRIHTVVQPSSFSSFVFPGSYALDLVVAAANAENRLVRTRFSFDGRWLDDKTDMFSKSVNVTIE
jgi:hypothetical protein